MRPASGQRTTVLVSATMTPRVVDAYARWTTREVTTKPLEVPKTVPTLAEAAAAVAAGLPIPDVAVVGRRAPSCSAYDSSRPPPLLITTDPLVSSPKKGPFGPAVLLECQRQQAETGVGLGRLDRGRRPRSRRDLFLGRRRRLRRDDADAPTNARARVDPRRQAPPHRRAEEAPSTPSGRAARPGVYERRQAAERHAVQARREGDALRVPARRPGQAGARGRAC